MAAQAPNSCALGCCQFRRPWSTRFEAEPAKMAPDRRAGSAAALVMLLFSSLQMPPRDGTRIASQVAPRVKQTPPKCSATTVHRSDSPAIGCQQQLDQVVVALAVQSGEFSDATDPRIDRVRVHAQLTSSFLHIHVGVGDSAQGSN